MAFRFLTLTTFFALLFGGLGFNLYRLQVEKGAYYLERAQARSEAIAELALRRGQIFVTDRNNEDIPVALNRDYPVIYAVPKEIENASEVAHAIAALVGWEEGELEKVLSNRESLFRLLLDRASPEVIQAIETLRPKGIYVDAKQYRFYPFESLASHVLGFVGVNDVHEEPTGLYGIEKFDDEVLRAGGAIHLTIDRNIQAKVEETLERFMHDYEAVGGTVIVQEPATGKIIALVNKPDFNPNTYKDSNVKNFVNTAVQYVYEPGPVMKPITISAGLDIGAFTPETTFTDPGFITLNGKTIRNYDNKVYGSITPSNILEHSINVGAVLTEQRIGHTTFHEYLTKFGFGEVTGVDLPDEVPGSLKNLERAEARAVDFATAAFGQGTAATPLQVVTAFSAIANGGLLMRPYIHAEEKPYVVRRVVHEETTKEVTKMLESTVKLAKIAAISQYRIAGKTGTALIPDFAHGGYTEELIHNFVGFAPASNPRFTMLVKLDKPKVGELAGLTVVPAFRELAQFILTYYSIPPDDLEPNDVTAKP